MQSTVTLMRQHVQRKCRQVKPDQELFDTRTLILTPQRCCLTSSTIPKPPRAANLFRIAILPIHVVTLFKLQSQQGLGMDAPEVS